MAWKDGFVIEYAPRKKKRRKKREKTPKSTQRGAGSSTKPKGALAVGKWVESPKHGKGKVVAVDGKWISVEYTRTSMRKRYDLADALDSGKLRRL